MWERWTSVVLRVRVLVLALWLAIAGAGLWSAARLPPLLSNSFDIPGTDSARANAILTANFHDRTDGDFVVVFASRDKMAAGRRLRAAALAVPTGSVGPVRVEGDVTYAEIDTALDLKHAKRYTDDVRRALAGMPRAYVTGQPAIQHDLDPVFSSDLRRGEAIAVPAALLVLLALFGLSLAVVVPFVFAGCTITAALALVYLLAHRLDMVTYVTNLVELIGLGLAIDYSLLVVHRFREELARGRAVNDAIAVTAATAIRSVVFSGVAVAIGLGLLLLVPVPFIRSIGVAGLVIPIVSIAAALTLQPVLLSFAGRRAGAYKEKENGAWERLARAIMRRPKAFLAAGTAVLAAAAVPALWLHVTPGSFASIPSTTESMRGLTLLRDQVGQGAITPTEIVVDGRASSAAVNRLVDSLMHDPEVAIVASGRRPPYVDTTGRYTRVVVAGRHEYGDIRTRRFVVRLRDELIPQAHFPANVRVLAGGAPPQGVDFLSRSYSRFPWLVLVALAVTFVVLLRAFRSLVLPLKAALLNLLTVAAVYGLLELVFRRPIDAWIPILLFAVLFGLSMDYEVFLVSRMREVWDETHDNARAVAQGLERTGRVVTAAALIMVVAFAGFVVGRVAPLREFGTGLCIAVLLDVTIVRALLVPALMAVLGRWNWWLPERAAHGDPLR
ncbi:MAG: MMPL family transporter [Gaiellaceae bacterium]